MDEWDRCQSTGGVPSNSTSYHHFDTAESEVPRYGDSGSRLQPFFVAARLIHKCMYECTFILINSTIVPAFTWGGTCVPWVRSCPRRPLVSSPLLQHMSTLRVNYCVRTDVHTVLPHKLPESIHPGIITTHPSRRRLILSPFPPSLSSHQHHQT